MKRVSREEAPSPRGSYSGSGVSDQVKQVVAQIALNLVDGGMPLAEAAEKVKTDEYGPSERTLYNAIAKLRRGEPVVSPVKNQGRPPALTDEQWSIVFGWVLCQEKKVELFHIMTWVEANFGAKVSIPTVSRACRDFGFSVQLACRHPRDLDVTEDEYAIGYFEFVKELHDSGFFNYDQRKIICLDSVTNTTRYDREKTINLIGSKQKKLSRSKPIYTNNYLVCVALQPGLEFDVLMFTYDPTFNPDGAEYGKVKKWCKKLGITLDQIFYEASSKKYCAEQAAHIATFKDRYRRQLSQTRVLHDGGPAYKIGPDYILADGANRLVVFPTVQHGELSPLDNRVNGIGKALWRARRTNVKHSYDALLLLQAMEEVGDADVTKCWTNNFLLDEPAVSLQAVRERLRRYKNRSSLRETCATGFIQAYDGWLETHVEQEFGAPPPELNSTLNGEKWKK